MVSEKECLFCKIIRGEISSKKVYEDEETMAILDINPASEGHMLVMPKKHSETIFDVKDDDLKAAIATVKKMCDAIKETLSPDGINVLQNNGQQAGQIISHIHFHVVPRYKTDKIVIGFPRNPTNESELNETLEKLKDAVKTEEFNDEHQIVETKDFAPVDWREEEKTDKRSRWDF